MEDKFETVVNTLRAVERKEDSKHYKKISKKMKIYREERTKIKSHAQYIHLYKKN